MEKITVTVGKMAQAMHVDVDAGLTLAEAFNAADPDLLGIARCGKMKIRLDGHVIRPDQLDSVTITQDGAELILTENIQGNE